MQEERRMLGEILFHGFCGALLASLAGVSIQWWVCKDFSWGFVAICGLIGFLLAAYAGVRAIELLKEIWWWS